MAAGGSSVTGGEWMTQRERKQTRDAIREEARRLKIEWADKLWLCQNHPVDDAVLAWLSEHRAEASKIGSSRWNLETLPGLVARQAELRKAAAFEEVLQRASVSTQTVTVQDVLGSSPQLPLVEIPKRRAHAGKRQPSRKRSSQSA
jgi:hypothetical protein